MRVLVLEEGIHALELRLAAAMLEGRIVIADNTPTLTQAWIDELVKKHNDPFEPTLTDGRQRKSKGERKRNRWRLK